MGAESEARGDPEAVDAPWLTEVLEEAGVARGAKVTEVELTGGIGTGQIGRMVRYRLTWDDSVGRPASVMGKFAVSDPGMRAALFGARVYAKEWMFYDQVAPTLDVRAPRGYTARYDEEALECIILMEDLADSRQGDQIAGLSRDQVSLALEQAVRFHAPRYADPSIAKLAAEVQRPVPPEVLAQSLQAMYEANVPTFLERLGDRLDAEVIDLLERLRPDSGRWMLGMDAPTTLVHIDFRADNFLFGATSSAPPIVIVDWQTWSVGHGGTDVAYVIAGSFPDVAERAAVEKELVEEYRAGMRAAGVDRSADEMWEEYRFGSIWGVLMSVNAAIGAPRTDRGDAMLTAMVERHGQHVIDLDALSLLV